MEQKRNVVRREGTVVEQQVWDLWYPDAAAQGLPFARGRLDVAVRADDGRLLAQGTGLARTADRPIARLSVRGDQIAREDLWSGEADLGRLVILPGCEVGVL